MAYLGKTQLQAANIKRWTGTPGAVNVISFITLGFKPLNEQSTFITINGVKQHDASFILTSAAIQFNGTLLATDEVEVVGILNVGMPLVPADNSVQRKHLAPSFRNITQDKFSGNGSVTAYTLSYAPMSSSSILVFLNGVSQLAGTDFTVSSTTLTFTTAPITGTDNINVIHLTYATGTTEVIPTDGSVTTPKVADGSVTDSKIVGISSSKLSGALPAISGANLTNLPASTSITQVSDQTNTSTGYLDVPAGTTAQRDANPATGMIRFNTTINKLEYYNGTAWGPINTPPLISSTSLAGSATAADPAGNDTLTISGNNFVGSNVKFKANDGTLTNALQVTIVNSTTLTVLMPALTSGDYDVVVTNNDNTAGTFSNGVTVNGLPAFVSPAAGSMGSFLGGTATVSITILAAEPDGGVVAYSVTTGIMPAGLTFSGSAGTITGTPTKPAAPTITNFTITATDNEGQVSTRDFSITVMSRYLIDNSLRFNDDDSAYLSWTPSTAGNRKTWTWSGWVKRGNIVDSGVWGVGTSGSNYFNIRFQPDHISVVEESTSLKIELRTDALLRDPSAWYHILLAIDTTQGTASNRAKLYVNGEPVTSFSSTTYPSQNIDLLANSTTSHYLGRLGNSATQLDGYLAEVHFIDGTALNATHFGEYDSVNNQWVPKEYTGTYGTNGVYLPFKNALVKHTLTGNTGIQHSTTQYKFGATSIKLVGGGTHNNTSGYGIEYTGTSSNCPTGTNKVTYEAWIYYDGTNNDYSQIWHGKPNPNADWYGVDIALMADGKLRYWNQSIGGSNGIGFNSSTGMPINQWSHFACTIDNKTVTFYINGTNVGTLIYTTGEWGITERQMFGAGFDSYIDEIRISNTVRYTANFTPPTTAFVNDANTILLIHSDTSNGSTTFIDDAGVIGGLGNDASSNSNTWTLNNLVASDQMLDTPTNNFCTLNPLVNVPNMNYYEGNLKSSNSAINEHKSVYGTMVMSSGKWYWEADAFSGTKLTMALTDANNVDIQQVSGTNFIPGHHSWTYADGDAVSAYTNDLRKNGTIVTANIFPSSISSGEVISMAFDADTGNVWFAMNGMWTNGSAASSTTLNASYPDITVATGNSYIPVWASESSTWVVNFGQDSSFAGNKTAQGKQDSNEIGDFYYEPPTGFLALCTDNLPEPAVIPSEHFNTVTYAGNSPSSQSITGVGFTPDLSWFKSRSVVNSHNLVDSVRGDSLRIRSDTTQAEVSATVTLDSDGFTVGSQTESNIGSMVAWNWKAGGTAVSNTNGSITSSVSANADAGFSIVSYVGNQTSGATVGHGLSSAPEMVIIKNQLRTSPWAVYHHSLANDQYLRLNETSSAITSSTRFNSTDPSSTVFTLGNDSSVNGDTASDDLIAYCFHSVDGYSKVGSYTGNGSTDGTFVYTGFRPAYFLIKDTTSGSGNNWTTMDSTRNSTNVANFILYPNDPGAETSSSTNYVDMLSNGFKIRSTHARFNQNGHTYIFLAFAEMPFKHSNAR